MAPTSSSSGLLYITCLGMWCIWTWMSNTCDDRTPLWWLEQATSVPVCTPKYCVYPFRNLHSVALNGFISLLFLAQLRNKPCSNGKTARHCGQHRLTPEQLEKTWTAFWKSSSCFLVMVEEVSHCVILIDPEAVLRGVTAGNCDEQTLLVAAITGLCPGLQLGCWILISHTR